MFARPESLLEDVDKVVGRRDIGQDTAFSDAVLSSSEVGQGLIMLATSRMPPALIADGSDATVSEQRQQAARSIVATWLLSSDSSMYQILGVAPDCSAELLRENYRRLMGLVHPDTRPVGFPNDSASRVNFAYGIVSDEERRASYDASLALLKQQSSFPPQSVGQIVTARLSPTPPVPQAQGLFDRIRSAVHQVRFGNGLLVVAALILLPTGVALFSLSNHEARPQIIATKRKLSMSVAVAAAPEKSSINTLPVAPSMATAATPPGASTPTKSAAEPNSTANGKVIALPEAMSAAPSRPVATVEVPVSTSLAISAELKTIPMAVADSKPQRQAQTPSLAPVRSLADAKMTVQAEIAPVPRTALRSGNTQTVVSEGAPAPAAPNLSAATATPAIVDTMSREARAELLALAPPVRSAFTSSGASAPAPLADAWVNAADADDILIKLSSAYESGSIAAFAKVFAPAMAGRRQVLSDYERVFQRTRQRSIRFADFKHKINGERLITSGYAVVSTVDHDNHASSQRIFLEIDISRAPEGLKIERLRNYPMN